MCPPPPAHVLTPLQRSLHLTFKIAAGLTGRHPHRGRTEQGAVPSWPGRRGLKPERVHLPGIGYLQASGQGLQGSGICLECTRVGLRSHTLSGEWTFTVMSTVRAAAAAGTPAHGLPGRRPEAGRGPVGSSFP